MTDGPPDGYAPRTKLTWTDTFRVFQVALDPRKLVVAAAGILVMALGWYALSALFWSFQEPPKQDDPRFSNQAIQKKWEGRKDYTEADLKAEGDRLYQEAVDSYTAWAGLAAPGGRLRTLPWYEYRGPNPFTLLTDAVSGSAVERQELAGDFLSGTVPVLVEPLVKLLLPVIKLLDPYASTGLRIYLLLCLVWSVATWAFFGGVITRIAAVQLTGKDRVTLPEAVKFVVARYTSYLLSPLVPVAVMLVIVAVMALYGTIALIPFVGDVILYGLGLPLVLLGGVVLAVLLIGLVGYPLMFATISVEGTDTFDALSRSYNYVFQAPWTYAGRALAAVLYGAIVTFFVVFAGSLAVYMGKWAVSQALLSETTNRKPDYLFVYAPESFGWKELLLKGSRAEITEAPSYDPLTKRRTIKYVDANGTGPKYMEQLWLTEKIGAGLASVWLTLALLLVIGFSYSYFWSASTLIYLAMRQKVDETEPDEIYLDDDVPSPLPPPATGVTTATGPAAAGVTLPTTAEAPAVPGVTLSPTVAPPTPSAMSAASPEVGTPVKADGGLIKSPPAPVSTPPVSPPTTLPPPPSDGVK